MNSSVDAGSARASSGRFVLLASALFVVLALRRPDALLNPQFWAEDGTVYFSQALIGGPATIFLPHAQSLWILPRMVALAATLLPVLWAPFAFNLIALTAAAGCCALFSLPAYRHLVRSDWLRVGSCVLFAAAVSAGGELIGTVANMPWFLALAAVGAAALRSESVAEMRGSKVVWIAAGAALCALSSPVVAVAAPLALWQQYRAIGQLNWKTRAIPAALLGGTLIQGLVDFKLLAGAGHAPAPFLPNLPLALLFPCVLRTILGEGLAKFLADRCMWPAAIGASLLIAAFTVVLFRRLRVSILLSALLLMVGPVAMAIAGRHMVWATWTRILSWDGQRYFLLPACAVIFLAAACIDTFPRSRYSPIALLLSFALGIAGNFRVPPYPDLDWPRQAYRIRHWLATGCEISFPVPPGLPWLVRLPSLAPPDENPCGSSAWLPAKAVDRAQVGPAIPISEWNADPAWTRGGFHPSVGALSGETLYGSYSGSDANTGMLTSAPFETGRRGCIALPIAHGPSTVGQSVRLIAADTGADLGRIRLDPNNGNWQYWAIYFSPDIPKLRIVADDRGGQFGQWVAVGEPHACR
jgi:hypothetical protein